MNSKASVSPPKWPLKLLKQVVKPSYLEEIEGDMEEIFYDYLEGHSPSQARRHYIFETLKLLRPNLLRRFSGTYQLNFYGMFKLLVKTSIRNYFKHRMVATMSLLTLVFGTVCFQLIYAWIQNEKSMDQFHGNSNRIHIAVARLNPKAELTPLHVQRIFGLDYGQFPQIQKSLTIHTYGKDEIKMIKNKVAYGGKALIADSTFFDFFDFKLLQGDKHVLEDPSSVVLSKTFADKLFPEGDAIGKLVEIRCDQTGTYKVGAITKKIPSNSSIGFDFIVPRQSKNMWRRMPQDLILVSENFDREVFNQQIAAVGRQNERFPESEISTIPLNTVYKQQPFHISLFDKYGDQSNFQTMEIVAVVIFLITLISFVNLQSTLQLTLAKKIGVKQMIGANRFDLGFEIIVSRLFYLLIATTAAFGLYQLVFPKYISTLNLDIDAQPWTDLTDIFISISLIISVSIIVALVQTYRIKTMQAISGQTSLLKIPRSQRFLTTLQYSVTILLLVSTSVVFLQVRYMLNMDTGLNQSNILKTDFFELMPTGSQDSLEQLRMTNQYKYVMGQIEKNPNVVALSQGAMPIDLAFPSSWKIVGGSNEYSSINTMPVDPEYAELFGIELLQGRFFADSLETNGDQKLVINEAAMKFLGIEDINSTKLTTNMRSAQQLNFDIVGVVKDYHYEHLSQKIRPLILSYYTNMDSDILVRYKQGSEAEVVSDLENLYAEVNPGGFFTYSTMESKIDAQYEKEERMGKIYLALSVVALLLSSIGLFTFAFHETKRRTKEIGIRKVNGARVQSIFWLLSSSFLKSIIVAFVLACPVAWYFMKEWLTNFANRIHISWWIFASVGLTVAIVALIAVSFQTIKSARLNPVDSLRYE